MNAAWLYLACFSKMLVQLQVRTSYKQNTSWDIGDSSEGDNLRTLLILYMEERQKKFTPCNPPPPQIYLTCCRAFVTVFRCSITHLLSESSEPWRPPTVSRLDGLAVASPSPSDSRRASSNAGSSPKLFKLSPSLNTEHMENFRSFVWTKTSTLMTTTLPLK